MREETGLKENDIDFIKNIDSVKFIDFYEGKRYDWEVFPFLFETRKKDKIHIDWEHSEYRWITPSEIRRIDTVPHFRYIVLKVLQ